MTPPKFQGEIIDEYLKSVPFDDPADSIGISFVTPQHPRPYQIGDELQRGMKKVGERSCLLRFKIFYQKIAATFSRVNFPCMLGVPFQL